jgi:superfamily II RNA helicase
LKSLNEENNLLKEHLRNADGKMTRLARVNDELTSKLDIENQDFHELAASEQSEYQVSLLTEKIKRLAGLLKAEKLKTADAIQEKNSINAAIEENERQTREKILELEQELEVIRTESESLKASLEKRPRISMNSDNLNELSEKLQGKQRMIENLLNEKSALVLLLENEVRVK